MTLEDEQHQLRLVAGYDRRCGGEAAVRAAAGLAELIGATVHVVHAVDLADYGIDPDIPQFETERDRHRAESRRAVGELLAHLSGKWVYHDPAGDPAARLAQVADSVGAYLIVVGADHGGLLRRALGENVVQQLLKHHHRRPVLVIPVPQDRPDEGISDR